MKQTFLRHVFLYWSHENITESLPTISSSIIPKKHTKFYQVKASLTLETTNSEGSIHIRETSSLTLFRMCKIDQPQEALQASSDLCGSEGSESWTLERRKMRTSLSDSAKMTATNISSSILSGVLHGVVWSVFALNFPIILSGREVGDKIYPKASYEYDPSVSLFDNTIWTYGTDYGLATIMMSFAFWILRTSNDSERNEHKRLARVSASMLILYAISTGAGAIAHHNYLTVESRNSLTFRLLWTICVGTVYLAPISMGMIGNECLRIFQPRANCPPLLRSMPRLTDIYWILYGTVGTVACALGYMSHQRPACDIFIAGITQTPCTFYCMGFLYLVEHPGITKTMKIYGNVGFIMNAFLLPLYPILVLNLGWSLAATNTLLHANLCVAWSLQGLVLQRVVKSLVEEPRNESQQKPLKKKVQ